MKIRCNYITKLQFSKMDCPVLFESTENLDKRFAYIQNLSFCYRFSWSSELIDPQIVTVDDCVYSIGFDFFLPDIYEDMRVEQDTFL